MNDEGKPVPPAPVDIKSRPSRARYDKVKSMLDLKWRRRQPQSERLTRELADALWDAFGQSPWIWCGFWMLQPDGKAFQPGSARPQPAPAAVPAEGALAEAVRSGQAHPGQTTIIVPVLDKNARVWAVFEARSTVAFDEMDARWLERLFKAFQAFEKLPPPLP
jgi:putative methionine-R-sulfoxide reductase with GAF domain